LARGKKGRGPALRIRAVYVLPATQCGLHRGQVANLGRLEERGARRRADLPGIVKISDFVFFIGIP
jgi:hypothetical protein